MTLGRLLILSALLSAAASAQWLNYPSPGSPRTADGKADLTAPAPRAPDGKPDLSGVWRVQPTPEAELKRTFGGFIDAYDALSVPGMSLDFMNEYFISVFADVKPNEAPLKPKALQVLREHRQWKICMPGGPITPLVPDPHKIVQAARQIVILYEADGTHRQIYTDGRGPLQDIEQPSWTGYSAGTWEGDTLVVETNGFNDQTRLDLLGHPHGENLLITERYHRRDFGHMDVAMTFDDPEYYTKPFTIHYTEMLLPDTDVLEFVCNENEKDSAHDVPAGVRARR